MAASKEQNVLLAANSGYYYIYNYNIKDGSLIWMQKQPWFSNHHGGHFSKPAIVHNRLIVKPAMYELNTGVLMKEEVPKAGHGCASYALSEQSAFYRGGSVTQFNFDTKKFSQWDRLRPDCWISTIPAQGLVLSPEAGGGCSCGNWLETSMVFAPKSRAPLSILYRNNTFVDTMTIEVKARDKSNKEIYYTLNGETPNKSSKRYIYPIKIREDTELKVVVYLKKNGKDVPFERTKSFVRSRPSPKINETPQLNNGFWEFSIDRVGQTGVIYYTMDNTKPTINSNKYTGPVKFNEDKTIRAITVWDYENNKVYSKETGYEIKIPELIESINIEAESGLIRSFYKANENLKNLPSLNDIKPTKTTIVHNIDVSGYEDEKMFAIKFSGYIEIPVDGMYTLNSFSSRSLDIVKFHGENIIETRGVEEKSKTLPLRKGMHPLEIEHYVGHGTAHYELQIEGPTIEKQLILPSMLKH